MPEAELVETAIEDAIEEVRLRFSKPAQKLRLDGAMEGFGACRGLGAEGLKALERDAAASTLSAMNHDKDRYWYWRERQLSIEWIRNVLGAARLNAGLPPLADVTARGMAKAAAILGVAGG